MLGGVDEGVTAGLGAFSKLDSQAVTASVAFALMRHDPVLVRYSSFLESKTL